MGKYCYCPTFLNVVAGIFMIFLAISAFFNIWEIFVPLWLSVVTFIIGVLLILLNSVNSVQEKINTDNLNAERANRIHASEGY